MDQIDSAIWRLAKKWDKERLNDSEMKRKWKTKIINAEYAPRDPDI
jgi:ribosomal protein L32E